VPGGFSGRHLVQSGTADEVDMTPADGGSRRVLLVEDDASVREVTAILLEASGFAVDTEPDGAAALLRIDEFDDFDVLVLDIMLPHVSGLDVCREVRRRSGIPILFLSARDSTSDVVVGLELGGDDYLTKPFQPAELVARVRALARRVPDTEPSLRLDPLHLDLSGHRAFKRGVELALSATEFRLLHELAVHAGQVLSRDVLLERVWNHDYLGDSRLVDMAIRRLREKVEDDPHAPAWIVTVRGVGYRLDL
jgi:two-component system response regulator MtrA